MTAKELALLYRLSRSMDWNAWHQRKGSAWRRPLVL